MRHEIYTYDGGSDGLLPGRWLANVNTLGIAFAQGAGPTEQQAVDNLKAILAEKLPNAPWYQSLPVVDCSYA